MLIDGGSKLWDRLREELTDAAGFRLKRGALIFIGNARCELLSVFDGAAHGGGKFLRAHALKRLVRDGIVGVSVGWQNRDLLLRLQGMGRRRE